MRLVPVMVMPMMVMIVTAGRAMLMLMLATMIMVIVTAVMMMPMPAIVRFGVGMTVGVIMVMIVMMIMTATVVVGVVVAAALLRADCHQIEQGQNHQPDPGHQHHRLKNAIRRQILLDAAGGVEIQHHAAPKQQHGYTQKVDRKSGGAHGCADGFS
jgi:hypothetical protein